MTLKTLLTEQLTPEQYADLVDPNTPPAEVARIQRYYEELVDELMSLNPPPVIQSGYEDQLVLFMFSFGPPSEWTRCSDGS